MSPPVIRSAAPANIPGPEEFKVRFVLAYERFGGGYDTWESFCESYGFNFGYLRKRRSEDDEFAGKLDRLREYHKTIGERPRMAPILARKRHPQMNFQLSLFLEAWRESEDRGEALRQSELRFADIERAIKMNTDGFRDAYREIERELFVKIFDAHVKEAMKGKAGALSSLLGQLSSEERRNLLGMADTDKAKVKPEEPEDGDYGETERTRLWWKELFAKHNSRLVVEASEAVTEEVESLSG